MQEKTNLPFQDDGPVRLFNGLGLLSHNSHVKRGLRLLPSCGFCKGGVGALTTEVKSPEPESGVVEGGGADEEGNAPSASDSEWIKY